jgi:hypothetical protein
MVAFDPRLILYVILTVKAIGLVKVILGEGSFRQTAVVPLIDADGVGRTTIVLDPDIEVGQFGNV